MTTNLAKVQSLYGHFGRGDVPAVIAALDPEIEWTNPGPADISYFGVHRGRDAVGRVFAFIGENFEMRSFAPTSFLADGDTVLVLIDQEAVARRTGKSFTQTAAHLWTFRDGRIVALRDFQDTHAVVSALRRNAGS